MTIQEIGKGFYMVGNSLFKGEEFKYLPLTNYLLGYDGKSHGKLATIDYSEDRLPILNTPLRRHLNEVYRFLFSGGIQADVVGADNEDPRQTLINNFIETNKLNSLLYTIWEMGASTGEILLTYSQSEDKEGKPVSNYSLDLYDATEFTPIYGKSGELFSVVILKIRQIDNKDYLFKTEIDSNNFIVYPKVELRKAHNHKFTNPEIIPHNWGVVPAVVIENLQTPLGTRGLPEFDKASLEIALEIASATLDSASNHHYFANPIFLSPDPEETRRELQARVQVLLKEPEEDGGKPELLQPIPMPSSHKELVTKLEKNLAEHLGTSYGTDTAPPDTASVTLKLLNAKTISTAEERWSRYAADGLVNLLGKLLISAGVDGVLTSVNANDPSTYHLEIRRKQPYFTTTPQEKLQILTIAESLINLGVRREVALREFYPDKTDEQILSLFDADF